MLHVLTLPRSTLHAPRSTALLGVRREHPDAVAGGGVEDAGVARAAEGQLADRLLLQARRGPRPGDARVVGAVDAGAGGAPLAGAEPEPALLLGVGQQGAGCATG